MRAFFLLCFSWLMVTGAAAGVNRKEFQTPDRAYRPMPFWHLNGTLNRDTIRHQVADAGRASGFGGITILPVRNTAPEYLSQAYFDRYTDIVEAARKNDMELILYDDIDFPSGTAGGKLRELYPRLARKFIQKDEYVITGPATFTQHLPQELNKEVMAITAMNINTFQLFDLQPFVKDSTLTWTVPLGAWRVMFFNCLYGTHPLVDYMDSTAVHHFMGMTYDAYGERYAAHFGKTIQRIFYDDIGFNSMEKTWTPAITQIFEERYGRSAALTLPALFYDMGPDSEAIRVAYHTIRSELMAEGYPRHVAKWCAERGLQSIGHPPGNYTMNSTELHGDILKFYRHTQIPLADYIFYYGYGRNGHKQISSAADLYDRPMVGAEVNGAFKADMDSLTLYRVAMDLFARGINFLIPHGMWYDNRPEKVYIPPVISSYNPLLAPTLRQYSDFVARSCYLLQGGRRVSKIAMLYPIASTQGNHKFDIAVYRPWGEYVPPELDFHRVSDLLTNSLRRDWTLIHPESMLDGRITIERGAAQQGAESSGTSLRLNNVVNFQEYDVLILPGGKVLSAATLQQVKAFYLSGGKVIATTALPSKSAEFGADSVVCSLVESIFGSRREQEDGIMQTNPQGGKAIFVAQLTEQNLQAALEALQVNPDVLIHETAPHTSGNGVFNYIHKQKEGREIYFFSNSTDERISTQVEVLGELTLEAWNPYTGTTQAIHPIASKKRAGKTYTLFDLELGAVRSTFVIGSPK